MFGDFGDELADFDWIDMGIFMVFSFMTLILFTNILIAYMGDAHEQVKKTMEITTGHGTAELLVELETIFEFMNNCCCNRLTKNTKEGYILCAEYLEEEKENNGPMAEVRKDLLQLEESQDGISKEIKDMKKHAKKESKELV